MKTGLIHISAVSYLNASPFIYGIEKKLPKDLFSLELDNPALCAEKILSGKADIGLVPVAVIPRLKEHYIVSDYCIGSAGSVRSVMLYSDAGLSAIKTILLDYQSRTSALLTRVLAKHLWKISPAWSNTSEGFEKKIGKNTAGLVIGDRTFGMENKFRFSYDLSEEWMKLTGLPFVFACWAANRPLPASFLAAFNDALLFGLNSRPEVIKQMSYENQFIPPEVIGNYLTHNISYLLDAQKQKGMAEFFRLASSL